MNHQYHKEITACQASRWPHSWYHISPSTRSRLGREDAPFDPSDGFRKDKQWSACWRGFMLWIVFPSTARAQGTVSGQEFHKY